VAVTFWESLGETIPGAFTLGMTREYLPSLGSAEVLPSDSTERQCGTPATGTTSGILGEER